ncbi:hypothetical protein CPB84DRAFT_1841794 [Gymnopilus junonius]|uniref:Uncharacterized protein n=1 Tax=Gymnopilus junonius TaxID=109634 RepID=A0A9P5P179_GYMJU|nr:hypothetical protein CPB84DRAFT_1841794 [Gymnopilus junonius]
MSLPHPPPTHTHHTEYADPVVRPPSPTSSIGTAYAEDQTSEEELNAEKEVLVMIPVALPGGGHKMVRAWDLEHKLNPADSKVIFESIMTSLRAEVAQLQENELFEKILLRGSKAALETQPSTNDIDALMRSMMGPAMNLGEPGGTTGGGGRLQAHLGRSTSSGLPPSQVQRNDPFLGVGLNHPQPQHGVFNFERRDRSSTPITQASSATLMPSGTTIGGKRSRNGTSRPRNP